MLEMLAIRTYLPRKDSLTLVEKTFGKQTLEIFVFFCIKFIKLTIFPKFCSQRKSAFQMVDVVVIVVLSSVFETSRGLL